MTRRVAVGGPLHGRALEVADDTDLIYGSVPADHGGSGELVEVGRLGFYWAVRTGTAYRVCQFGKVSLLIEERTLLTGGGSPGGLNANALDRGLLRTIIEALATAAGVLKGPAGEALVDVEALRARAGHDGGHA